jgi:hypothetical protein
MSYCFTSHAAPKLMALLLSIVCFAWHTNAYSQDAIINEWSQGEGGTSEWVEILVIKDQLDMRDWMLLDGNTNNAFVTFGPSMRNLPAGTLIVVYNYSQSRASVLPTAPDTNGTSDCEYRIYPTGDMRNYIAAFLWSGNNAYNNGTTSEGYKDNPRLYNAAGQLVQDWDNEDKMVNMRDVRPDATQAVYFTGGSLSELYNVARWQRTGADSSALTPGLGNGGANSEWIQSLRTIGCMRFVAPTLGTDEASGTTTALLEIINPSRTETRVATITILNNSTAEYGRDYRTVPPATNQNPRTIVLNLPPQTAVIPIDISIVQDCENDVLENINLQLTSVTGPLNILPEGRNMTIAITNVASTTGTMRFRSIHHSATLGRGPGNVQATVRGGVPPYQYSLNGGANQAISRFNTLRAGENILQANDSSGCEIRHRFTVNP